MIASAPLSDAERTAGHGVPVLDSINPPMAETILENMPLPAYVQRPGS